MSKKQLQVPTICIQPDGQPSQPLRRQSTDGRFTIIDEQSKDSDSFDETSSDNDSLDQFTFSKSGYISKCSSPNLPHLNYSISQPSKMSTLGMNTSRFRVVPVEAKYQRKRWLAWDWFDPQMLDKNQTALAGTLVRASHSNPQTPTIVNKPMFQLTPPTLKRPIQHSNSVKAAPLATPEPMSTHSLAFDFSDDDSDRENSIPSSFEKNQITVHQTDTSSSNGTNSIQQRTSNIRDLRDELQNPRRLSPTPSRIIPLMSGRISPSEMLNQYGLERSLSATSYTSPRTTTVNSQFKPATLSPGQARNPIESSAGLVSATTSHTPHSANNVQPHVGGSSIVAIDSKIEQAMDLVKTHLMFAVREEVDHLRSRIMELETAVVHLEAENSILREHVPSDILKSLSIQPSSNSHGATAMT